MASLLFVLLGSPWLPHGAADAATLYVARDNPSPLAPYTNWTTAATNIQDAIDAAASNDEILVTNGVYDAGGRAVYGSMTNRVAIDRPLTVRSVNGPRVTTIRGQGPRGDTAVRCAYVGTNATLVGFLLTNGHTRTSGDWHKEQAGGGAWCEGSGALSNCTLAGNAVAGGGGGAYGGTLNNCILAGNVAGYGVLFPDFSSGFGGGAYYATLNNCSLAGNAAMWDGGGAYGGTLNNCTVAGNGAGSGGGGVWNATLNNCIVYFNTAPLWSNYYGGTLRYCCAAPLPAGTGNIAADPALASASHLSVGSPCLGAGSPAYAAGTDLDGEVWGAPPSIGCDEMRAGAVTGELAVAIRPSHTNAAVGFLVHFTALVDGRTTASAWDFGDATAAVSNRPVIAHAFAAPGGYDVTLRAFNETYPAGVVATVRIEVADAVAHYVRRDNPAPAAPYTNWTMAATNIQDALDAVWQAGAEVVVTNGVYDAGGRAVHGNMTNRVAIDKPVTVRSVNGPDVTAIRGQGPRGDTAVRGAYVGTNATLVGFLLTNGHTRESGDYALEQSGGGAWCEGSGALSNCAFAGNAAVWGGGANGGAFVACAFSGNTAYASGGGVYGGLATGCTFSGNSANWGGAAYEGILLGCTLAGNTAKYGGGAFDATLTNCTLSGNGAAYGGGVSEGACDNCTFLSNWAGSGGGASSSALYRCSLSGNRATNSGGGAYNATLNACSLTDNTAGLWGGGAYGGTLNNGALSGNTASNTGGGACEATLNNCTLSGNRAGSSGGGTRTCTQNNCIVYFNAAPISNNYSGGTLRYCCATPLPGGTGNLTNDPALASVSHLSAGSPCIGAGSTSYVCGSDIDGEAWRAPPSIGCDEVNAGAVTGGLLVAVSASRTNPPVVFPVTFSARIDGRTTASVWDFGDGAAAVSNRAVIAHGFAAPGSYDVILRAFNETHPGGVAATARIEVAEALVHYVRRDNPAPVTPYTNWATAATNIQDAIDAASDYDVVLVTNGVYDAGGRALYGAMTNRVAVGKWITVRSVHGPGVTAIMGRGPPGDAAVRCAYVGTNALLTGFLLTNGGTRITGDHAKERSGGGAWCEESGALSNCVLSGNAAVYGGGAGYGVLRNCTLSGNTAGYGGGAGYAALYGCALAGNTASGEGGGAYESTLNSCTLIGNVASNYAGGAFFGSLTNCILYFNTAPSASNYYGGTHQYCCTIPSPAGAGHITNDPALASISHLSAGSPCLGAGGAGYVSGTDIDGESWLAPPSIGCDELRAGAVTGALRVVIGASTLSTAKGLPVTFSALVEGRTTGSAWNFGDATPAASNRPVIVHAFATAGVYEVTLRACNESYPGGVAATARIEVAEAVIHYVRRDNPAPAAPYTSWATAATNIQDAIDAAASNEMVLVTNGVYDGGGRAVYGTMTNRVAVTKPILVRSVNGPGVTTIRGQGPAGAAAVRCAYMGTNATLAGFLLAGGGARTTGDLARLQSGGGAWCEVSAVLTSCILAGNAAGYGGGGAYYGTLNNCILSSNTAAYGGGAYRATLRNCALSGNAATNYGGGANEGALNNCTLTGNAAGQWGGGVNNGTQNNCIVYFNTAPSGPNYNGVTMRYCCTTPSPGGTGNITSDPALASPTHLSAGSPCLGAGSTGYVSGVDLDGEAWGAPPSIGCDELRAGAVTGDLRVSISASLTTPLERAPVAFSAQVEGRTTGSRWEFGDGTAAVSNLPTVTHAFAAPGGYDVILRAFNETYPAGVAATVRIEVAAAVIHFVRRDNPAPLTPYTNWATAATNIQDAIDAASAFDMVLVTNGVYDAGGRAVYGGLTNRAAIDKPLLVRSVHGPDVTWIVGQGPLGTAAVRCAYVGTNAILAGFLLTNGATRTSGDSSRLRSGGGAWCEASGVLSNCTLAGNAASYAGGGANGGALKNCILSGNAAGYGGGAFYGALTNCALSGNTANYGGGAYGGTLNNCTLAGNTATNRGGGAYVSTLNNGIVYFNAATVSPNYDGGALAYCCTIPLPSSGVGNITNDPALASASRLSAGSPCLGAGNSSFVSGTDLDGEAWRAPPAMGCDEVYAGSVTGSLRVAIRASYTNVAIGYPVTFLAQVDGRATRSVWDFADGMPAATNRPAVTHAFAAAGSYDVILRAFNETYPAGVAATARIEVAEVVIHYARWDNPAPAAPYTNWATAATNIQDAIDAAWQAGARVVVTNGVYDAGGRVVHGSMTNRVVIAKPITVRSVNGPAVTAIRGQSPRGDTAVRCAYVGANATLAGFLLTNGSTRTSGDSVTERSGGGVWCEASGVLSNCILAGNSAEWGGGACYGTLSACTLAGNWALNAGGGTYGASASDSTFGSNSTQWGGGAYDSTLNRCTLTNNVATSGGGGAYYGTLNDCTLANNVATNFGGGATEATLSRCTLTGNSAANGGGAEYSDLDRCVLSGNWAAMGGGAFAGTLTNCTLSRNTATNFGGGAAMASLYNCTLADNSASNAGGGASGCMLTNCIVYFNAAPASPNGDGGSMGFCCTTPLPLGDGNLTNDPAFVDLAATNLRLLAASPCVDAGTNGAWTTGAVDLDGQPRVVGGRVDLGAYEHQGSINPDTDGDGIPDAWEAAHGLNPAVSNAPDANADGDPFTDWQEYVADTDPTNAAAYLRIQGVRVDPPAVASVRFASSSNRMYTLLRRTNLVSGAWADVPGEGPRAGLGGLDTRRDTNDIPGHGVRAYRVDVRLP